MADQPGSAESLSDKRSLTQPDDTEHVAAESLQRGYEVQEAKLRPVLLFAAALAGILVATSLSLWWLTRSLTGEPIVPEVQLAPAAVTPEPASGPGIQAAPALERRAEVAPALERITTYGVDQETGAIHIPVERAMELLAERGLPAADGEAPVFGLPPAYELDSEGGQEGAQRANR